MSKTGSRQQVAGSLSTTLEVNRQPLDYARGKQAGSGKGLRKRKAHPVKRFGNWKLEIGNWNGVTLIEMVVASAIVSLVAILVLSFLADKVIDNHIQSTRSSLLGQARQALDTMGNDVRHSSNVDDQNRWEDNHSPGAPTDSYSWQSDDQTLVLARPVLDSSDNFIYQDPFAYITHKDNLVYFVDNGTLYRRTLAADIPGNSKSTSCPAGTTGCRDDSTLADNVTGFTLDYYDALDNPVAPDQARSVRVTIALTRQVYNRNLEVSYQTRWVFRNE